MFGLFALLIAGAVGAAIAYFFDPDGGRGRRAKAKDRAGALMRRGADRIEKQGRHAASRAEGFGHQIENALVMEDEPPANDATLAQRVESQILRGREVPKGSININVEDGVVVLRGEVDEPGDMRELEEAARSVKGVRGVRSLLHLRGTTAPTTPAL